MFELGRAARAGDVAKVKSLLCEGVQVNSRDSSGSTPLHYACESEDEDMQRVVNVLLDAGADVNAQDVNRQTPLHVAVQRISFQTKQENNAAGGDNEETPLAISSKRNEVLVKTLLREGALVNVRDREMRTALHRACRYEWWVIEDKLLEAGAETNIQDEKGQTPLHVAIVNIEILKALLTYSTKESSKERSSQYLVDHPQEEDKVRMVNSQDKDGNTALHLACTRSCFTDDVIQCVRLLLCEGAKVGVKNNDGMTALHMATCYSKADVVDILLNNGEDVNATDKMGNTPLHMVSEGDRTETVRLLLSKGAEVGVKNNNGETALHLAARYGRAGIVDILLNNGEDLNATNEYGNTPLHAASEAGQSETVRLLYRKGAKMGVKNRIGQTPLHKAAAFSDGDISDVLVDHGEYVSSEDNYGNTPLHYLCEKAVIPQQSLSHLRKALFNINLLIIRGAKIDEHHIYGENPHEKIGAWRVKWMKTVEKTLITQVIRLKTLGLQDKFWIRSREISWILGQNFYDNVKFRCFQELESIKSTIVVKDISLYQVLSHISQSFLVSTEDLQHIDEFLSSPDLLIRFPLYGDSLRITFQRAKLLTLAVQSFYSEERKQMMKKLPCEVAELLVNFLSNKDLRMFIESE